MDGMAYTRTDPAESQKMHDRISGGDWWKPKDDKSRIRILPPTENRNMWWAEWPVHWNVGPQKAVVVCLAKKEQTRCAVCDQLASITAALQDPALDEINSNAYKKMAEDMKVSWACHINMVDMDAPQSGVQVARIGKQIMQGLIGYDVDEEYGGIDSPEDGFTMTVIRNKGGQPYYEVRPPGGGRTPLQDMTWLNDLQDLDAAFRVYTYDEQGMLLRGERVPTAARAESAPVAQVPQAQVLAPPPVPLVQSGPMAQAPAPVPAPMAQIPVAAVPQALPAGSLPVHPQLPTTPAPVVGKSHPRCYGDHDADPICNGCTSRPDCIAETAKARSANPNLVSVDAPTPPRCFKKQFVAGSQECITCPFVPECSSVGA